MIIQVQHLITCYLSHQGTVRTAVQILVINTVLSI